jgi:hypothetical protein
MPLITRQGKGSKLTIQEMDGNLTYLKELSTDNWVLDTALGTISAASISDFKKKNSTINILIAQTQYQLYTLVASVNYSVPPPVVDGMEGEGVKALRYIGQIKVDKGATVQLGESKNVILTSDPKLGQICSVFSQGAIVSDKGFADAAIVILNNNLTDETEYHVFTYIAAKDSDLNCRVGLEQDIFVATSETVEFSRIPSDQQAIIDFIVGGSGSSSGDNPIDQTSVEIINLSIGSAEITYNNAYSFVDIYKNDLYLTTIETFMGGPNSGTSLYNSIDILDDAYYYAVTEDIDKNQVKSSVVYLPGGGYGSSGSGVGTTSVTLNSITDTVGKSGGTVDYSYENVYSYVKVEQSSDNLVFSPLTTIYTPLGPETGSKTYGSDMVITGYWYRLAVENSNGDIIYSNTLYYAPPAEV